MDLPAEPQRPSPFLLSTALPSPDAASPSCTVTSPSAPASPSAAAAGASSTCASTSPRRSRRAATILTISLVSLSPAPLATASLSAPAAAPFAPVARRPATSPRGRESGLHGSGEVPETRRDEHTAGCGMGPDTERMRCQGPRRQEGAGRRGQVRDAVWMRKPQRVRAREGIQVGRSRDVRRVRQQGPRRPRRRPRMRQVTERPVGRGARAARRGESRQTHGVRVAEGAWQRQAARVGQRMGHGSEVRSGKERRRREPR